MNKLREDIWKDAPWDMLFADDIVLPKQNYKKLENDLEIWKNALERRGLNMNQSKTEYLKLQGEKIKRAENFKYLGSTVSSDGKFEEEVRRRIQAG